jgi:predicted RNase H-like HicB family nuclease
MTVKFTLEHWQDDGWYVGKIKEIPGIFSQGETLEELIDNIMEAYDLMMDEGISG